MSGLGKGGKGLGKGGAKRHRKVLRDNIQGITKPAIRRCVCSFVRCCADRLFLFCGRRRTMRPRNESPDARASLAQLQPRASWRREAHLEPHLRGDARRAQGLPRERHSRRRHLHGARAPQDGHVDGRRLRAQAPGPHALRLRRLSDCRAAQTTTTKLLKTSLVAAASQTQTQSKMQNHGCFYSHPKSSWILK